VETSEAAMATAMARAQELAAVLQSPEWQVLEALRRKPSVSGAAAVTEAMQRALADDEHVTALRQQLRAQHQRALELLTGPSSPPSLEPPAPAPRSEVQHITQRRLGPAEARQAFREIEQTLKDDASLRVDI